jgi:hypothetical protein
MLPKAVSQGLVASFAVLDCAVLIALISLRHRQTMASMRLLADAVASFVWLAAVQSCVALFLKAIVQPFVATHPRSDDAVL